MTSAQGIGYGAVQGLSEFLPVSSSAHLALLPWFAGWEDPGLGFDVALHVGTLLAVLWYFWRDWWELAQGAVAGLGGSGESRENGLLFWKIVVASIPAAVAGVALEHEAEEAFRAPVLIAAALAALGALLYWGDRRPESRVRLQSIDWMDALWIGAAQAAAIVPGVSRSGVTITAARLRGIGREASARFSFLLSTPVIAGASLLKVRALAAAGHDPAQLLALVASAFFGFLAIGGLIRYVRQRSYLPFVLYRFALAALVIAVALERARPA
jgi:undecaprenyl-diphosphatase